MESKCLLVFKALNDPSSAFLCLSIPRTSVALLVSHLIQGLMSTLSSHLEASWIPKDGQGPPRPPQLPVLLAMW